MSVERFFRKELLEMPAYHLAEHDGVKLNQNEAPWDLPVPLKALGVEALLKTPWNRYPLGDTLLLKKKLAKHLGIWADNLVIANGSNVLIQALVMATSIDRNILTFDPTFSVYELEANLFNNTVVRVPLNEEDFSIPEDLTLRAIKKFKPSLIFIANPNAPTGNLFDISLLKKIIAIAPGLVVIDEAYYPFSGTTMIDSVREYENLVVLRTFSKAFALGGLRLGYVVCETDVARNLEKCLLPFCVSKIIASLAMVVLDHAEYINQYVKTICSERERVYEGLKHISSIKVYPSQANFILFQVENSEKVFKSLLKEKVIIRQVSNGRSLTNALRVSIGTPEENDAFLSSLTKVLA
ncbi:MAG: histidinol-phosphate transaminase [Deltaproteobacteria bacterium RIFCSPLOWO2_12_FULL_40_28]|nr:MAG: histidinol-phosphate transaminase [Deltaproteobacteria bacterium RIFCSPHIGHO2_02_FULL_40_28]OGQ19107.1 MAG: histidinol-phosphate transaminase [Deltaproteobacteria bacterium RIFCSPHIGHO2_12_FULL_40_32]OGQ40279.1 MAG: histidinol-phosphate transaminase [Deltaproteobacteria bacterium RIFCSPLOWO2_02_FULL_40_36]OGQ53550.1 MAG: histidinol-phosphate transaminase [Deltaproteobacteria bacterium RIFCSPLOWO2_12_FULL_40_28]